MKKPAKLTPSNIIRACRAGARLCKAYRGATVIFTLQPPGVRVLPVHALAAIRSGDLVALRDGLFPNNTQTWTARKDMT